MTRSKKKILILPSWYPTRGNAIVGSFFREQALLISDEYDVKVLRGTEYYKGYKRQYLENLFSFPKQKLTVDEKRLSLEPPAAVDFQYPIVHGFNEVKNFDLMLKHYDLQLQKLISEGWKPDLIHAHSAINGGLVATYLSKQHSIPFIITEHQLFLLHTYRPFVRDRIFDALRAADKVLAVSYHQMRCILMHGITCDAEVIGNYINESLFPLKEKLDKTKFKILAITYPAFIKDNETFFKAIASMVKKGHTDIIVTVIGNDSFKDLQNSDTDTFSKMAGQYGVSSYCHLINFVERDELPSYYQDHDVFVSTSIAETFGVAVGEALTTGTPVVCTASGGVDDTVDNSNGIKVNIRDHEAVADALIAIKAKRIVFDPIVVRNSIVQKFGTSAFKERLLKLYGDVVNTRNPQAN